MVNSIQSIEPMYPKQENTPPRPTEERGYKLNEITKNYEYIVKNQKDIDLWQEMYGTKFD